MPVPATFKVYNASAGSGKTFTLVKEYLKILLATQDPHRFQNILAITFTNKAAAEMKERVITNLREFTDTAMLKQPTEMFSLLSQETSLAAVSLQERAKKVLKNILHNYSAFNITTIDSFTHRLIRNFAFDLGLSLNFDVEMDTKALLDEAVDLLISKIGEDEMLTQVLIDFSLQKTNEDKSWDVSYDLKEIAELLLRENDLKQIEQLKDKELGDFLELKGHLKKKLSSAKETLTTLGRRGLQLIDDAHLESSDFYRSMLPNHFKNLVNDLSKARFFDQSTLKQRLEERNFYAKSKPEDVKAAIESIIDELITVYEASEKCYQEYTLYSLFLKNVIPLAVLSKINDSLQELKEDKNIHLNAEFNQLISSHLRAQPAAFIYERIGEKYKHYFIDEMQDTSELQWQNLIPLIENALSQEHSSLMLVGDAKQSIYRWRGGEPKQFIGLSGDQNPFYISKETKFLDTNHRSYSEIVNFNNGFFQFVAKYLKNNNFSQIYRNENRQKSTGKIGGYVNLSFIPEGLLAEEKDTVFAEQVLATVVQANRAFELNEICVLTRTRKQGVAIANFLTAHGIAIISSETLLLQNSNKVKFIINLLTYLMQPSNKEAKLDIVYFLYEHFNITSDQHEFLSEHVDLDTAQFFENLKHFGSRFDYEAFNKLPFYESIEVIIREFKLTQTSDAYLQFFLDEVLQYTIKKSEGAFGFLNYWDEKKERLSIEVPQGQNAVRIMTIHKSKGLEFPVIIFPYDLNIYRELSPKAWYPLKDDSDLNDFDSLLVNSGKALALTGDLGTILYQQQQNELELDNLNLLYVTLTRASEQLYIISEKRKVSTDPKWYSHFFMLYLLEQKLYDEHKNSYEFGNKTRISPKSNKKNKAIEQQTYVSSSWGDHNVNIVATSALLWDNNRGISISYGNLIHELLSKIKTNIDIEEAVELYVANGMISNEDAATVNTTISAIVNHPELADYFDRRKRILCEREILTADKEIVIPDRLVIDASNRAVIIDYKTGKPDKKYLVQMRKYEVAVASLGYTVAKKLLVYIDDDITIEEV